jgi:hypothetical protein
MDLVPFTMALAVCIGCGASQYGVALDDDAVWDSAAGPEGLDSDTSADPESVYWGLGGSLQLIDGAIDIPSSMLNITRRSLDISCDIPITVSTAIELDRSSDGALPSGWLLDVTTSGPTDCPWSGPLSFEVAFGVPEASLFAPADRAGLSVSTSYGLFVNGSGESLLIGVAGTPKQLDGSATIDYAVRPPDGIYVLHTLYGMPITEP